MPKILALLPLLILASCSSSPKEEPTCPSIFIEKATAEAFFFKDEKSKGITDKIMSVEILGYKGTCEYNDKHTAIITTIKPEFELELGPAAKNKKQSFKYFIAIPELYPNANGKQIFSVDIDFKKGFDTLTYRDEPVIITIPLKPNEPEKSYKIYLGLQLDKNQLDYNRDLKRYKYR